MTGAFFKRPERRQYRPRGSAPAVRFNLSVAGEADLIVKREAELSNVSVSAFYQEAALRLAALTYAEREKGLLPIPVSMASEELDLIARAASAMGITVERFVSHTLFDAASRGFETPENNSKGAAA
jgi:hypothetical protein